MLNTVTATQFIWQQHKNRKWRKYKKSKVKSVGKKCDGSRKKLTKTPFENWALDRSCKHREDFTFLGKTHSSISYLMLKFEEISFSLYWKVDQNYIIQRICSFENTYINRCYHCCPHSYSRSFLLPTLLLNIWKWSKLLSKDHTIIILSSFWTFNSVIE